MLDIVSLLNFKLRFEQEIIAYLFKTNAYACEVYTN